MSAIFGFRSILQQVERSSDARATRLGDITSSDVEKTRRGKLSDDESWSRWNEWIRTPGRELHYLYGARRPARFSRYAVPLRFLVIFECGG